jgi:hypothetical protein
MRTGICSIICYLSKQQRRYVERRSSSQGIVPAVKMLVGDWYTDELGVVTREVKLGHETKLP